MTSGEGDKRFVHALKRAVSGGDFTTARRLIKGGVDINNPSFWFDGTLLHEAVATGNKSMVQILLQAGATVNAQDKAGRNSLHLACRHGYRPIVQLLISVNADVNAQTKDGRTCLHIAIWRGYADIAQWLMEAGASVNRQDEVGSSLSLLLASKSCTQEAVSLLLSHGYDVHRDRCLQNGRLPLTVSSNTRTLIQARLSCVLTLSQLCRTALRRRLREVNGGKDLTRRTSRLPLPQLLQEFLLYAHQPNN